MKRKKLPEILPRKKKVLGRKKLKAAPEPGTMESLAAVVPEGKKLKKKKFLTARCAYHNDKGNQCPNNAVGKSTLCAQHGGDRSISENMHIPEVILDPHTKYNPAKHPIEFIQLAEQGMSPPEIANQFNVTSTTLLSWTDEFPTFAWAMDRGRDAYESYWLKMGKDNITNSRNFNFPMFKYLTGNKLGYSDKIETKSMNQHLHGVLVVPVAPKSAEEWEKQVAEGEG